MIDPTELDTDVFDTLEDYDSADFWVPQKSNHDYLKGMWTRFRATSDDLEKDTIVAHTMVQSFVNAFARDGHYAVSFNPQVTTAGTDMDTREVIITPAPIADHNLTAEEAGLILTGLAVHEISHPRYGRMTAQAVERSFPRNRVAMRVSNLLDDIRIERRFIEDYPGYAGIFDPLLAYIGARGLKKNELRKQKMSAPVNLAIAATRYPEWSDWSDPKLAAERDWWQAWGLRWGKEDAPKRHVDGIREALIHIINVKLANPKQKSPTPPPPPPPFSDIEPGFDQPDVDNDEEGEPTQDPGMDGENDGEGEDGADAPDDAEGTPSSGGPGDDMSDASLNAATNGMYEDFPDSSCSGSDTVDQAANLGDTSQTEIDALKKEAQNIIDEARNTESDGHGGKVDVCRSTRELIHGRSNRPTSGSQLVTRHIRNAIIQSRTGHMEREPYRKTGRLDQGALTRIAHGDFRLFEKRSAPSVGEYLVWIMVDSSMSMEGHELRNAARVTHSIAAATQSLHSVRMAIWAWTTGFRPYGDASVAKVWETGMKVDEIFKLADIQTGGTPDSTVMGWAHLAIKREARHDETPVIIFISDGAGVGDMNERVKEAQDDGVIVVSVSFGGGFSEKEQIARFGEGNYVTFDKSIEQTGKPLAKMFMKIVSGRWTRR